MALEGDNASVATGDQNGAEELLVKVGLRGAWKSRELLLERGRDDLLERASRLRGRFVFNLSESR